MNLTSADIKILTYLLKKERAFITEIFKAEDINQVYCFKEINKLERARLIQSQRQGRKRYVNLTSKGSKLAKSLIKSKNNI